MEGRRGGDRAAVVGLYWKQVAEQVGLASSKTQLETLCAGPRTCVCVCDATHSGSITHVLKALQPRMTVVLYGESSQLVWGSAMIYYTSFGIIAKSFGCYFKSAIVIK